MDKNVFQVNTKGSLNRLLEYFSSRLKESVKSEQGRKIFSNDQTELFQTKADKIEKLAVDIQNCEYLIKGFLPAKVAADVASVKYSELLEEAKKVVGGTCKEYRAILINFNGNRAICDIRSITNTEQDLHIISKRISRIHVMEDRGQYVKNPRSFDNLLKRALRNKDSIQQFVRTIEKEWNLRGHTESARIFDYNDESFRKFVSSKGCFRKSSAVNSSNKIYGKENKDLITFLCNKPEDISHIQKIVNEYKEKFKKSDNKKYREKLAGYLFRDLLKMNNILDQDIMKEHDISANSLSRYKTKGINAPMPRVRELVNVIPDLKGKLKKDISYMLARIDPDDVKKPDDLLQEIPFDSGRFMKTIFMQSLMELKEFADYLGIHRKTLKHAIDGRIMKTNNLVTIREKIGVSSHFSELFIRQMSEKLQQEEIKKQNRFSSKNLESVSLF